MLELLFTPGRPHKRVMRSAIVVIDKLTDTIDAAVILDNLYSQDFLQIDNID